MAVKDKIVSNPKTGQTIRFIRTSKDTGGMLLEMESYLAPSSTEPPSHYHPNQEEIFEIIEGSLTVKMKGQIKKYNTGEVFKVPRGTHHSMWNDTNVPMRMRWSISPAMKSEYFFETVFGLSLNQKTNEQGLPSILQVALLCKTFEDEFRLSKPPFAVQKIVFAILSPIARIFKYKGRYPEYEE